MGGGINVIYLGPRSFTILCYIFYISFIPVEYTKNQLICYMTSSLVSKLKDTVETKKNGVVFIVVRLHIK